MVNILLVVKDGTITALECQGDGSVAASFICMTQNLVIKVCNIQHLLWRISPSYVYCMLFQILWVHAYMYVQVC